MAKKPKLSQAAASVWSIFGLRFPCSRAIGSEETPIKNIYIQPERERHSPLHPPQKISHTDDQQLAPPDTRAVWYLNSFFVHLLFTDFRNKGELVYIWSNDTWWLLCHDDPSLLLLHLLLLGAIRIDRLCFRELWYYVCVLPFPTETAWRRHRWQLWRMRGGGGKG